VAALVLALLSLRSTLGGRAGGLDGCPLNRFGTRRFLALSPLGFPNGVRLGSSAQLRLITLALLGSSQRLLSRFVLAPSRVRKFADALFLHSRQLLQ
jgi:hypothetical protein